MINYITFYQTNESFKYGIKKYLFLLIKEVLIPCKNVNKIIIINASINEIELEKLKKIEKVVVVDIHKLLSVNNIDDIKKMVPLVVEKILVSVKSNDSVLHINDPYMQPLALYLKQKVENLKVIYTIHKNRINYLKSKNVDDTFFQKFTNAECSILKIADVNIFLTDKTKNEYEKYYSLNQANSLIVKNSIPNHLNENQLSKEKLKAKYGFTQDDFLLLYVGRLDIEKGTNLLFKIFEKLECPYKQIHLIIIGSGDYVPPKMSLKKIHLFGYLSSEEIMDFYKIADIGIIPSKDEECSFVCIEMLKFGLPIISLANSGQSEILNTGLYSEYLVKFKHGYTDRHIIEEFILKINKLIESSYIRKSLSNQSLRIYNNSFSFNRFVEIYRNLISPNRS